MRSHLFSAILRRTAAVICLSLCCNLHLYPQSVTWMKTNGPNAGRVTSLAVNDAGTLFAGTTRGIFRSVDRGMSWSAVNNGIMDTSVTVVATGPGTLMMAGTSKRQIHVSTNSGANWTMLKVLPGNITDLKITPSGTAYVVTQWGGMYRSVGNGVDWVREGAGSALDNAYTLHITRGGNVTVGAGNLIFWYHPTGGWRGQQSGDRCITTDTLGSLFAASQGTIWRARNMNYGAAAFNSFQYFQKGIPLLNPAALVNNGNGRLFMALNGVGVYGSVTHGESWTAENGGLTVDTVTSLVMLNDTLFAGAADGSVYRTTASTRILLPPMHSGPTDAAILPAFSATLTWQSAPGAAAYRVQCSSDTLFQTGVVLDQTFTTLSAVVTGLPEVTRMFWRVRSENGTELSPYSAPWSLITGPVPAAPTLLEPADSVKDQPVSAVTVRWRMDPKALTYTVWMEGWASHIITDTFYTFISLPYSAAITWNVSTRNIAGIGPTSSRTFTTVDAPPVGVIPKLPANNGVNIPLSVSLQWNPVTKGTAYHVQLSDVNSFTGLLLMDDTTTFTTSSTVVLKANTKYWWRVRGATSGGYGPFSSVMTFTTLPLPSAPALRFPEDSAAGEPPNTLLGWNSSMWTDSYRIQILSDTAGWDLGAPQAASSKWTVRVELQPNTVYHWRVAGINAGGSGPWSAVRTFRTTAEQDIMRLNEDVPDEFTLEQNFPNPFTDDGTWVQFAVPIASPVRLSIHSLLGTEVVRILDETVTRGVFRRRWVPEGLASGIYICVMRAGPVRSLKKMVYVK